MCEGAVQTVEHDDEDDWSSLSGCDESTVDLLTFIQSAEEFCLRIVNLAPETTGTDLESFFSDYRVERAVLPFRNARRGKGRPSYGFLKLKNAVEVERSISVLSGKELFGHTIILVLAFDLRSGVIVAKKEGNVTEAAAEDEVASDKSQHMVAGDTVPKVSEVQVKNALSKIEDRTVVRPMVKWKYCT